jgi:hypothetical protein
VTGPSSQWVTGLSGAGVQELADWLENNGCRPVEVSFQGEAGFAVRCVCPPGLVLGLEAGELRLFPAGRPGGTGEGPNDRTMAEHEGP